MFAVYSSIQTDDRAPWSVTLTPTAHAAAFRENPGDCLNCHEASQSLGLCRQPFTNASGCLNSDLGQVSDDGEAYRHWQTQMNRYRRQDKSKRSNKKSHKHNRRRHGSCGDNTRAKVRPLRKMTAKTHTWRTATTSLGLATMVDFPPHPPLPLLFPPLASIRFISQPRRKLELASTKHLPHWKRTTRRRYGTSRTSVTCTAGGKHINLTRCSCYRLGQCSAPTSLDSCFACRVSAKHVVPYIRSTQRHSDTCFCKEPTSSFVACYEFSRCYAGDRSLRLERPSSQGRQESPRFKRRSVGDGSPSGAAPVSYGITQATEACASGAAPLSLGTGACARSAALPPPRAAQ